MERGGKGVEKGGTLKNFNLPSKRKRKGIKGKGRFKEKKSLLLKRGSVERG